MTYSPTIRRKRLSNALRQLRRDSQMTIDSVAAQLSWDSSKLSRMESNVWKLPRPTDIDLLCDVYTAGPETRDALLTLARQARERGWWEQYKDVLGPALPGLEAEAARIRHYHPLLAPGLLQTPDYTRAICRASMCDNAETERRVEARRARQRILYGDHPPLIWAVIDEAALRKMVGGWEVMRDQVNHLLEMSARPKVVIQVLPNSAGAHAGMGGPIVLLDYESDPTIVFVENMGIEDLFLESPDEVARYTFRYGHVMASALSVEDSKDCLRRLLEELKARDHE